MVDHHVTPRDGKHGRQNLPYKLCGTVHVLEVVDYPAHKHERHGTEQRGVGAQGVRDGKTAEAKRQGNADAADEWYRSRVLLAAAGVINEGNPSGNLSKLGVQEQADQDGSECGEKRGHSYSCRQSSLLFSGSGRAIGRTVCVQHTSLDGGWGRVVSPGGQGGTCAVLTTIDIAHKHIFPSMWHPSSAVADAFVSR